MINGLWLGRKAIPNLGMGIAFFSLFFYQACYSETPVSIHGTLPSPDSDRVANGLAGEQAVNPEVVGCLLPLSGSFALYRKTYEAEPGILAAAGYDTLMFLSHVLVQEAPRTRQDLQRAMRASKGFTGLSGKMVFNDRREVIKNPTLYTIRGKRLVALP